MKILKKSDVPTAILSQIGGARFVLLEPKMFGDSTILAFGMDPKLVAQGGLPVQYEGGDKRKPLPPHVLNTIEQPVLGRGELYRIDP